jgi:hypothetical protein
MKQMSVTEQRYPWGVVVTSSEGATPDLLSIGINVGGMTPANHLIHEALGGFMRMVIRERTVYPNEGLRINIVFHLAGPIPSRTMKGFTPLAWIARTCTCWSLQPFRRIFDLTKSRSTLLAFCA